MIDLQASIGFIAGMLTTAANVPQVWKTYKNRSAEGLSFRMLITLGSGLALWVVYGVICKPAPIIVANIAGFLLIAASVAMKFSFDANHRKTSANPWKTRGTPQ
jgi:MtN3 and saliva related transmembrane protein